MFGLESSHSAIRYIFRLDFGDDLLWEAKGTDCNLAPRNIALNHYFQSFFSPTV